MFRGKQWERLPWVADGPNRKDALRGFGRP